MPYIHLNDSKINYHYLVGDDLFIVSGIVDSSCSYKSPLVIRSKQELDIYFGKSFKERDYFDELIESGVSLLIHKPISTERRIEFKSPENEERFICTSEFPKKGVSDVTYIDSYTGDKFIWNEDTEDYINILDLPENIYDEQNYESWYNRDTLRLCSKETIDITKKKSELFLQGKIKYVPNVPDDFDEDDYDGDFETAVNINRKPNDTYCTGISRSGSYLFKLIPDVSSPWDISRLDFRELVISDGSETNKDLEKSLERVSLNSSTSELNDIPQGITVFSFNIPEDEYSLIRLTYLPDGKTERRILLENSIDRKNEFIIKNRNEQTLKDTHYDFELSTSEFRSLRFYINSDKVHQRAWLCGYYHFRKSEETEYDGLKIVNKTDSEPRIFLDSEEKNSIIVREGINRIRLDYIKDFWPNINLTISVILKDDYEINFITWYPGISLLETIEIILKNLEIVREVSLGDIKSLYFHEAFKSLVVENPLSSCYPRYKTNYPFEVEDTASLLEDLKVLPDSLEDILGEERTLSFSLNFENISISEFLEGDTKFICLPLVGGDMFEDTKSLIWYNRGNDEIPLSGDIVKIENTFEIIISPDSTIDYIIGETIRGIKDCGYSVRKSGERSYVIYSEAYSIPNSIFSNISDLKTSINSTATHDILSQISEEYKRIEFYSKTIGPNDEDIKIKIEEIPFYEEKYKITISRFNYSETYNVNLYDTPDKDGRIQSLDSIINKSSRLVECKLFREKSDGTIWKRGDLDGKLPTGEWNLKRSYYQSPTVNMYWQGLNALKEFDVKEDFLCIPEIEYYLKQEESYTDLGYFPEYKDILKYCEGKNCQALIGNLNYGLKEGYPEINEEPTERMIYKNDESYEIFWNGEYRGIDLKEDSDILRWKNTFIYNLNTDYDNRLVYFYRDMLSYGLYPRPAYYVFLRGILENKFSYSTKELFYTPPVKGAFEEEEFEEVFEIKKANYMVSDNQKYFYKTYFNHPGNGYYTTTILTRFSMSKVSRALENNKWRFLGKQLKSELREEIEKILLQLKTTYSIYKQISLVEYKMDHQKNSLTIKLNLYLRELVDKPISLDVELNYIY